jgi:hypothetical protein
MTRYFAAAILAAAVCVVAIAAPAQAQNRRFQIASGDLGQALDAYIHQSGRQLIYRVDDVRGVHSPGVQGELSADDALAALLSGTGFSSRTDSSGAVAIVRDYHPMGDDRPLSEIVVTATAGGQGIERQKASFSTSTLSSDDIHRLAPLNTAGLMTRWIEIAAFAPIFRAHSEKGTPPKEPWVHGAEHTRIRRQFIEQRYRLMPYLYALADENARTGAPLMRPLFYDYPDALDAPCEQPTAFLLGDRLLIAPSPDLESPQAYRICLPAGRWYDYWTGEPVTVRPSAKPVPATVGAPMSQEITVTPALDRLPVFVRAGAILPGQPLVQSTSQAPQGPLSLDVYPGEDCRGTIYADDGHSMAYTQQGYLRQQVHCTQTDAGIDLDFAAREGRFQPWWHQVAVRVHHWRRGAQAFLDGKRIADPVTQAGVLRVTIDDPSGQSRLSLKAGVRSN